MLHINRSDAAGASGRNVFGLHQALRKEGEISQLFVLNQESTGPAVLHYRPDEDLLSRAVRATRRHHLQGQKKPYNESRPNPFAAFSDDRAPYGPELGYQLPIRDLVHLHSVNAFLDYRRIFPLLSDRPVVWTLHDMNPFTGGCHHNLGCGRFHHSCGFCPQLGSRRERDLSRKVHHRKQEAFNLFHPEQVRIVAVDSEIASAARASSLFADYEISHIPYGVDIDVFRPRDRAALRTSLDIPPSAFVVLFKGTDVENPRKGMRILMEALGQMAGSQEIFLLSIGDPPRALEIPCPHIHLGHFTDDDFLSVFYSAGDCLVSPSFQEAFDLPALEAMACATPVVGFDTAGLSDVIRPDETGLLARSGDMDELTGKIQWMKNYPVQRREMGEKARLLVKRNFSLANQARCYIELYQELQLSLRFCPNSDIGNA